MAASLLDRLGLGNGRAVANARQAAELREMEERMVAELLERIGGQDASAPSRVETVRVDRAA